MQKFKRFCLGIFTFIMCGFTYSLIKDNVIPNLKSRLNSETTMYSILIFSEQTAIKNEVIRRKPYFKDNIFYYYDKNGDLNELMNFSVIVTTTHEKDIK